MYFFALKIPKVEEWPKIIKIEGPGQSETRHE